MRYRILIAGLSLSCNILFSQDAIISQYNSFPLYTNMAMAGSKGCSRIVMGKRLQWLKMNGGYRTNYFSYDQYSRHLRSGFGFQYYRNNEGRGMITSDFFHFSFSPSICIGKRGDDSLRQVVIKPAFSFGTFSCRFDWSKYNFGDMIDPTYGYIFNTMESKNRETITAPDFGTGIFAYGENFFAGLYFQHITQPEMSILSTGSPLHTKMTLYGGYLIEGYKWLGGFSLIPSFIYEHQGLSDPKEGMHRTDITLTAKYKKFRLGVGGRLGSSLVFSGGFEYKFFKLGYSYDMNATHVAGATGSTHEIVVGFNFACRKAHKKIRTLDFPAL